MRWRSIGILCQTNTAGAASKGTVAKLLGGMRTTLAHSCHLLAMVAVEIWSVSALPANSAWWGPATFMTSLVISAVLGAMGVTVPFLENLISLAVNALEGKVGPARLFSSLWSGLFSLAANRVTVRF